MNLSQEITIILILFCSDLIETRSLKKRSISDLVLPQPFETWGEYCRMKNPFHPKCRGIAVQKLIEITLESINDRENYEEYREILIGYVLNRYPKVIKNLLNDKILHRLLANGDRNLLENLQNDSIYLERNRTKIEKVSSK